MKGDAAVLLAKELREISRSRLLLASMSALPLSLIPLPVGLVHLMARSKRSEALDMVQFYKLLPHLAEGVDPRVAMIEFWVQACAMLFLIMPLFIPVLIGAQSVAGEKERRTIEALLATPLTSRQIVLGKSLAAVLPALVITWIAFVLFAVGVDLMAYPLLGRALLPDGRWLYAVLVLAPLFSFLGCTITVLVSSRVSDSRLAQQISALVVIPILGLVAVQFGGLLFVAPSFFLVLGLTVALADLLLFFVTVALFDRQRILSRWG